MTECIVLFRFRTAGGVCADLVQGKRHHLGQLVCMRIHVESFRAVFAVDRVDMVDPVVDETVYCVDSAL